MKRLRLLSRGEFAGEFAICGKDVDGHQYEYSIGDYLELTLLAEPVYTLGVAIIPDGQGGTKEVPVTHFLLCIQFSSEIQSFDCDLFCLPNRTSQHWRKCLAVGKTHIVKSLECHYMGHTWCVPEIDGHKPMFGKVEHQ